MVLPGLKMDHHNVIDRLRALIYSRLKLTGITGESTNPEAGPVVTSRSLDDYRICLYYLSAEN